MPQGTTLWKSTVAFGEYKDPASQNASTACRDHFTRAAGQASTKAKQQSSRPRPFLISNTAAEDTKTRQQQKQVLPFGDSASAHNTVSLRKTVTH